MTPWFAAATGFVIAAAMWVYSPHTVLSFPPSEPGISYCQPTGCVQQPAPHKGTGHGNLAIAGPGVQIHPKHRAHHRTTHGLVFKFTVLWHDQHGFAATISVTGHKVPASWRLSFDIPGAQIGRVAGVSWRSNADGDGGTASRLSWPSGGPGQSTDPGTGGDNNSGPHALPVITFLLTGSGPAAIPAHCHFDGASCTFQ